MDLVPGNAVGQEEPDADLQATLLDRLLSDLAERELELATLRAELHSFERVYLRTLGLRYAELDGLDAEIAELLAKSFPSSPAAQRRAGRARARAQESEKATNWVGEPTPDERRFVPSEDLKKLYRRVAKRVHPDLADDEDEREERQDVMAEANQAYAEGDAERLRDILEAWEWAPKSGEEGADNLEIDRVRLRIEKAETRLRAIATELGELRDSELYRLHVKVEEARHLGVDVLADLARDADRRIAAARRRLRALKTGGAPWIEEFFAAAERARSEGAEESEPEG